MLARIDEFVLFFVVVVAFFIAIEGGYRIGVRHRAAGDDGIKSHIKGLQDALLGLLALLLGFNFIMASSRFEARKEFLQEEVDAINTAWMRGELLPQRQGISELLRRYVSARIDYQTAGSDAARIEAALVAASSIEAEIWTLTREMVAGGSGSAEIGLFVESVNDMVNVKLQRRSALDNHVPEPVLYLLIIVAVGSLAFIGYSYGLSGSRHHVSTAIFALLIALVLATILDFDRPRGGFIRVGEDGLIRLQEALGARD